MNKLLVLFFIAVTAIGQEYKQLLTVAKLNGRWWNGASLQERMAYLSGFSDHDGYARSVDIPGVLFSAANEKDLGIPSSLFTDGMDALNRFFDNPRNLRVQVRAGVGIWVARYHGASDPDIEKALAVARMEYVK